MDFGSRAHFHCLAALAGRVGCALAADRCAPRHANPSGYVERPVRCMVAVFQRNGSTGWALRTFARSWLVGEWGVVCTWACGWWAGALGVAFDGVARGADCLSACPGVGVYGAVAVRAALPSIRVSGF